MSKRFTQADVDRLTGKAPMLATASKGIPKSPKVKPESESQIQQRIMRWWKYAHKGLGVPDERLLMAFPLQGARTARNGARMKAEGLRKGTPDLLLAVAGRDVLSEFAFRGLWIELKKHGGNASPEQSEFLEILRREGYEAKLCIGFDAAKSAIEEYLKA